MNVVADARLEHGRAWERLRTTMKACRRSAPNIIQEGQFRGYLSNRETARLIGLNRSSGTMRTEGWNRLPIIRMTNVSLLPGNWDFDDLIAEHRRRDLDGDESLLVD